MSLAWYQTRYASSGVERTNHQHTTPSRYKRLKTGFEDLNIAKEQHFIVVLIFLLQKRVKPEKVEQARSTYHI